MKTKNMKLKLILIYLAAATLAGCWEFPEAQAGTWGLDSVRAAEARRLASASPEILVAVIDTGIDASHPDLKGAISGDAGWDFVLNDRDLTDRHGHGTHIAGIIHQIAPNAKLLPVKYYDPLYPKEDPVAATIRAFNYAIDQGAQIINYSGGGAVPSGAELAAMKRARDKGILVVAAAGNERNNSDFKKYYPADYGLSNILSVTAHDRESQVLPSSNYGRQTVHLAAPGKDIESSLPGGQRGNLTGTSQATAFVTGAAALFWSQHPEIKDPARVARQIIGSAAHEKTLEGKTRGGGRLDLVRLLTMRDRDVVSNGTVTLPNNEKPLLASQIWQDR